MSVDAKPDVYRRMTIDCIKGHMKTDTAFFISLDLLKNGDVSIEEAQRIGYDGGFAMTATGDGLIFERF